jgi:hypothetical protein
LKVSILVGIKEGLYEMRLRVRTDFLDDGFLKPNYLKEIVTTNDC